MSQPTLLLAPDKTHFPVDHLIYKFIDSQKNHITGITWSYYNYNSHRYSSYSTVDIKLPEHQFSIDFGKETFKLHYDFPSRNGVNALYYNGKKYYLIDNEFCLFDFETKSYSNVNDPLIKSLLTSLIEIEE